MNVPLAAAGATPWAHTFTHSRLHVPRVRRDVWPMVLPHLLWQQILTVRLSLPGTVRTRRHTGRQRQAVTDQPRPRGQATQSPNRWPMIQGGLTVVDKGKYTLRLCCQRTMTEPGPNALLPIQRGQSAALGAPGPCFPGSLVAPEGLGGPVTNPAASLPRSSVTATAPRETPPIPGTFHD